MTNKRNDLYSPDMHARLAAALDKLAELLRASDDPRDQSAAKDFEVIAEDHRGAISYLASIDKKQADEDVATYSRQELSLIEFFGLEASELGNFGGQPADELLRPADEERFYEAFKRSFGVTPEEAKRLADKREAADLPSRIEQANKLAKLLQVFPIKE